MSARPIAPVLSGLLLLLVACDGKDDTTDVTSPDGDADTDVDSDTDTDTDTDVEVSEFGLDVRPPNPDCVAPEPPLPTGDVIVTRVFSGISHDQATVLIMAPGDTDHWYLGERDGRVFRFDDDPAVATKTLALDITGPVNPGGSEMGLLGIAFHPDFQTNGYLYVHYSGPDPDGFGGVDHQGRVARFTSSDGGATFDPGSEEILLVIDQPFTNHNGGTIAFGPDGYLYLGLGDGGSGGDPQGNGQDPNAILGKMLRIDVDGGTPYAIPPDNPFANGGGRPEIFAMGLRNPFRFSFDPVSGDLWVGDVGQNAWEEVDKVELGGNYGWNVREGQVCYGSTVCDNDFAFPVAVYPNDGGEAVIGGVVYRGSAIPSLQGVYLLTDFSNGDIIAMFYDPVTGEPAPAEIVPNTGLSISHFSPGPDGEVYLVDYYGGRFYKLEPGGPPQVDPFPKTLSATGCFDPADPKLPVEGLIPYDIAHSFWSDGAGKRRWLAIPDGQTITVESDGDWDLPVGSVLAKEFSKDGALVETRLMMRHPDGTWGGYSYAWNEAQTDADLVAGTVAVALPSQTWSIPGGECGRCHTEVAGGSLGPETRQLNTVATYPSTGRAANQLATLDHIGMFSAPMGDPETLGVFAEIDDAAASAEDRARTYLHVNCSSCHRPGGPTRVNLDLRYDTLLADMGICGNPEQGDLGVQGAKIVTPGDPSLSVLSLRMHRRDTDQMPPLGTALVDEVGVAAVDEWIGTLASCP